jgi:hypothetical protein
VRAQIILHQHDLDRIGKMGVGKVPERVDVIGGRMAVGDFYVSLALEPREHHE